MESSSEDNLRTFPLLDYYVELISQFYHPVIAWSLFILILILWFTGTLKTMLNRLSRWNSERLFREQHANLTPDYEGTLCFTIQPNLLTSLDRTLQDRLAEERRQYVERLEREARERKVVEEEKKPRKPIEDAEYLLNHSGLALRTVLYLLDFVFYSFLFIC
jgi:flagellar biosynthesis/type III secretory pathway chaperone